MHVALESRDEPPIEYYVQDDLKNKDAPLKFKEVSSTIQSENDIFFQLWNSPYINGDINKLREHQEKSKNTNEISQNPMRNLAGARDNLFIIHKLFSELSLTNDFEHEERQKHPFEGDQDLNKNIEEALIRSRKSGFNYEAFYDSFSNDRFDYNSYRNLGAMIYNQQLELQAVEKRLSLYVQELRNAVNFKRPLLRKAMEISKSLPVTPFQNANVPRNATQIFRSKISFLIAKTPIYGHSPATFLNQIGPNSFEFALSRPFTISVSPQITNLLPVNSYAEIGSLRMCRINQRLVQLVDILSNESLNNNDSYATVPLTPQFTLHFENQSIHFTIINLPISLSTYKPPEKQDSENENGENLENNDGNIQNNNNENIECNPDQISEKNKKENSIV